MSPITVSFLLLIQQIIELSQIINMSFIILNSSNLGSLKPLLIN